MKKYFAEFFGTFVLVFIGTGSAVIAGADIGVLGIAFAFGIAVLTMVYAIGPISGCHINPAITLSMLFAGKIGAKDSLFYILSQIFGAIVGSGVLFLIASGQEGYDLSIDGLGQNGWGLGYLGEYSMTAAFIAEVVLTAIFLLVIFGATSEKANAKFAGIAIGLALTMIHIVGIQITGTSVNPARSIGPALFVGGNALSQLGLFIVAPIIGGLLGTVIYKYLLKEK
jgi:aquaporin Z